MQGACLSWVHCGPLPLRVWDTEAGVSLSCSPFPGPLVEQGLHLLTLSRWEEYTLTIVALAMCPMWN